MRCQRPAAPTVDRYTQQLLPDRRYRSQEREAEAQRFVQNMDIPGGHCFIRVSLNDLIAQVLKANPDLTHKPTARRPGYPCIGRVLSQRRCQLQSNASEDFRSVNQLISKVGIYSLHTAQVAVAYAPDVFGGTDRPGIAESASHSQHFQLEAAYLTLTSNVVAAALGDSFARGRGNQEDHRISEQIS